jgi:hypothetical protein
MQTQNGERLECEKVLTEFESEMLARAIKVKHSAEAALTF